MVKGSNKQWIFCNLALLIILIIEIVSFAFKGLAEILTPIIVLFILLIIAGLIIAGFKWGDKLVPNGYVTISVVLLIAIITLSGFFAPPGLNYFLVLVAMALFFIILGISISGRLMGILIDERNQMSLSRFQMVVWTLIILSAFLTIALSNIHAAATDPLGIAIPVQIWALLGISTVSLVGSPLLISEKLKKESKENIPTEFKYYTESEGLIAKNKSVDYAQFADIFRGDEIATTFNVNMAKVQMFFFTIIIAISYFISLYLLIATAKTPIYSFPVLNDSIIALLAISHAGYLGNKSIDQTAKV